MRGLSKAFWASIAAALLAGTSAWAQQFPAKPVRFVTGGAGTFHDVVTRQLAQRLGERWGQPVVVENQGAAALTVGTGMVARAAPDGHTIVMSDRSALAVAPHLYKSVPYDPLTDLAPVTLAALSPSILVAHPTVPASTLAEFVAHAKAQPKGMHFASAGPGTNNHIAMALFGQATGIDAIPVHYKGGGASTLALVSGEVPAGFALPSILPHVKSGKLKAYAVTGSQRFPGAPDVPTAAELGYPGFELEFWIGVLAPAGTPQAVLARLNRDIGEILQSPALRETLAVQGARAAPGTPEAFAAHIKAEGARMKALIARTGMRAD